MENRPEDLDVQSTIELLADAKSGNDYAIELLYQRYLPPLQRWARGRLPRWARDLTDTDDLVQDTLLRTLHRLDDFEYVRTGAFLSYLRQGVMNRVRDEIRRVGRHPPATDTASGLHAHDPSPLEELIGKETLERYEAALPELKPADREAASRGSSWTWTMARSRSCSESRARMRRGWRPAGLFSASPRS